MLKYSHLIIYNLDTSKVEIYDKNILNVLHSFSLPASSMYQMVHDENNDKLWILNHSNTLYRYGLSEDVSGVPSASLEATITMPSYTSDGSQYGTRLCIDEVTGKCFVASIYNHTSATVSSVLVNGVTIDSTLALTPPGPSGSAQHYRGGIVYDQYSKELYFYVTTQYSNRTFDASNPGVGLYIVKEDLTSFDYDTYSIYANCPASNTGNTSAYISCYSNTLNTSNGLDLGLRNAESAFNRINGRIIIPMKSMGSYIWSTDSNRYSKRYVTSFDASTKPKVYCSKTTGDIYLASQYNMATYDYNMNLKKVISGGFGYLAFNIYSNNYYTFDSTFKHIVRYDSGGTEITRTVDNFVNSAVKMIVAPGTEDSLPTAVGPNSIVFPNKLSSTTDITPTVVVRVGDSPAGWTQQFRVIADTDAAKVATGGPEGTYLRMADSFASGANYKASWNWEYSSDYTDTSGDPALAATWSGIGTANGLQSGGSEPTNGVNCEILTTKYMKFTIPAGEELTGADTNTTWYFKVFSYSV